MSPQTRRIFRQTSGVRLLSPESCSEEGIRSRHKVIKLLGKFVYFRQKITDVRSSFTESITEMQDVIKKVWLSQPTWATKTTMGQSAHGTCNSTHGTCNSTHGTCNSTHGTYNSTQWATALMVHVTAHNWPLHSWYM